ncbi:MAG: TonB-dependent receptor [Paludibacteraceae bacterium]|nr:TonB-dependent receptor [Paludibacteraceae bacterium]
MKRVISIALFAIVWQVAVWAHAWGVVVDDQGQPLPGANVYWAGTQNGTTTDADGKFELEPVHTTHLLVTSFVGYHNDTTEVVGHKALTIVLVSDAVLDEVTITERKMSVLKSRFSAIETETLTGDELCKAACCNLSESFETSASVDVAYADAATGAKQIRLLGLAGTYVQLLTENTPGVRGLAQTFGMEFIPGPWMDAIQVSKGTSSVINGYEATAGQINVEFLKPQKTSPIAINAMLNTELHAEVNATGGWILNDHVSTGVLAHYQDQSLEMDGNKDGFLDMPKSRQLNLINRWYFTKEDYTGQIFVHGVYDSRIGGTSAKQKVLAPENTYNINLSTRRVDGFIKNGYVFDHELNSSIGIIAAASYHEQVNHYGNRLWNASQTNAYLNAMYQTEFDDCKTDTADVHGHKLTAGLSVNYDRYRETAAGLTADTLTLPRDEVTPGIFAEYTYTYKDKITLLAGIRGDWSNRYGFFVTPRMNIRYTPFEWWTLRASAGLGYRSPNIIADNANYLPSSRIWNIGSGNFAQEKAVNTGVTTTFYIPLGSKELQLSGEYFYTRFLDAVIADMDANRHGVTLFNLSDISGAQSFSHNWQAEATMEILRGWTLTAAFRYTDVKQTSCNTEGEYVLRDKPLQNRFKGIISTSYQTPNKGWQFDVTAQFNGYGRMPDGFVIPEGNQQYYEKNGTLYHKWYPQLMAQITKYFHSASIYLGAENMTNFKQDNPIVNAGSPYSQDFDASMVWAPIDGWKMYLGFRWELERHDEHEHEHHHEHEHEH